MDQRKVLNLLRILSLKHDIQIIYAVEAGSKTYGLHSKASDNDIRFIYKYNDKSIYNKEIANFKEAMKNESDITEMTIERKLKTITDKDVKRNIDYQGWDITFATKYLIENNPSIIEWIFTSIVYVDDGIFCKEALDYIKKCDPKVRMMNHYMGYARSVVDEIEERRTIELKILLKFIRSLIMTFWLYSDLKNDYVMDLELEIDTVMDDIPGILDQYRKNIEEVIQHKKQLIDEYRMSRGFKSWLLVKFKAMDILVKGNPINEIDTKKFKIKKIYKTILTLENIY